MNGNSTERPASGTIDEGLLYAALDALDEHIAVVAADGTIIFVNEAWRRYGSLNSAPPAGGTGVGSNYLEICDRAVGDDAALARIVAVDLRAILAGRLTSFKHTYPCHSPDVQRWFTLRGARLGYGEGSYALLSHQDVSERMLAEQAQQITQDRYRMVWEASNDALALSDPKGIVLDANPAYYQLYGGTPAEVIGASFARIFPPEARAWAEETYPGIFATQPSGMLFESSVRAANGTDRSVESRIDFLERDGQRLAMLSIVRDITERREFEAQRLRMEQQSQESQRLEGIGILAGGIAHDFNNMLTSIQGYTELALDALPPGHQAHHDLRQVMTGVSYVIDLTQQLLAYAGKGLRTMEPLALNDVIREMDDLLQVSATRQARLLYQLASDLPLIEGDVTQIRQVLLNLITNAADAVRATSGQITVSTHSALITRAELDSMSLGGQLEPGRYVVLIVADTGDGMDEATLARIFEPFFTTKHTGRGLGLASVQGIVRRHGGALKVSSAPGLGTTFYIALPALVRASVTVAERPIGQAAPGTAGAVLVIDDEASVRTVASRMLQRLGYAVSTAPDGSQGLELLASTAGELRAVLVDLTMPGLTGDAVTREIRARWPELPVILMSGYSATSLTTLTAELGVQQILQKPFTLASLRAALATALGETGG